jgi:GntR family transcriptional regulator, rspAB operon transcriptional repressor
MTSSRTIKRGRRWPEGAPLPQKKIAIDSDGDAPLSDDVYSRLRRMILYSELQPGEWLRQVELAGRLKVSRTPVREAMRLLSQEGLVELVPNYGARVATLSYEEFEELYALRIGIEGLAARLAAQSVTDAQLDVLKKQLADLKGLSEAQSVARYVRAEWRFRLACYGVTRRARLIEQIERLRERAERYLKLAYTEASRTNESFRFHRDMLDAIARHDAAEAGRINQEALRWTLEKAGVSVRRELAT